MSKHHYNVSKKSCISIYAFMRDYMDVTEKPWDKMRHDKMVYFAEAKGYDMPRNGSLAMFDKKRPTESGCILVRDVSGTIACYRDPKHLNTNLLLQELQETPAEELERRRQEILKELMNEEEQEEELGKRMIKVGR